MNGQTLGDHARAVGDLAHALAACQHLPQKLGQAVQHMGAEDQIHIRVALFQLFRDMLLLHHAAAHPEDHPRTPRFIGFERPDVAEHAILRMLPHGAGVKEHQIRLGGILGEAEAHIRQKPLDMLGIGHILLAAVGADKCQRRRAVAHPVILPHTVRKLLLRRQLFGRDSDLFCHSLVSFPIRIR